MRYVYCHRNSEALAVPGSGVQAGSQIPRTAIHLSGALPALGVIGIQQGAQLDSVVALCALTTAPGIVGVERLPDLPGRAVRPGWTEWRDGAWRDETLSVAHRAVVGRRRDQRARACPIIRRQIQRSRRALG